MVEYPDFIARFYDVIYDKVRTGVDNEYFLKKAENTKGSVLEIGVGTGRLFMDALNRGVDIYGLDISPAMIDVLHNKLPPEQRHRVWVENAVKMKGIMSFDLIIAPFRMFSHILHVTDQLKVLNKIARMLKPGGQFIFDLFIPNLKILLEGFNQFKDFDEEYEKGNTLRRYISTKTDLIKQQTRVKMKLCWEEKGVESTKTWNFIMRFFFRYEIEHLIARSDLNLVAMYGDHQENALTRNSTDFVLVCETARN